jgi:F0F1-type ATP synthase assembly protein I
LVSAVLITIVSEVSKKTGYLGGFIASLPITSMLALFWLYNDTKNSDKVAELSIGILLFVIPSMVFFIVLPILLKRELNFYLALIISSGIMVSGYALFSLILSRFGIKI